MQLFDVELFMLHISAVEDKAYRIPERFRRAKLEHLYQTVSDAILEDCADLIGGKLFSIGELPGELEAFYSKVKLLPDDVLEKESIFELLRIFVLVVHNRLQQFPDDLRQMLSPILTVITQKIGSVPILNDALPLPDERFKPTQYDSITSAEWKKIPWKNPSRGSPTEPLSFLKRDSRGTNSVRKHLFAAEREVVHHHGNDIYLSYADAEFYHAGDLQADHMQPSEQLVARQQELVLAMNVDPIFKAQMLAQENGKGYFIVEHQAPSDAESASSASSSVNIGTEKIYGTKKFYMEYHNCVGNLWMISAASNTGQGKGRQDAVDWLGASSLYGDRFFSAMGGRESIDKRPLLYVTSDGRLLAEFARVWFLETYRSEIEVAKTTTTVVAPLLKEEAQRVSNHRRDGLPWKHDSARLVAKVALIRNLAAFQPHAESDDHSVPSSEIESGGIEVSDANIERVRGTADASRFVEEGKDHLIETALHATSEEREPPTKRPRP